MSRNARATPARPRSLRVHGSSVALRSVGAALVLALVTVSLVHAQAAPSDMEGKTAEQFFKNIQVLQGTPADQLIQSMHLIKGALGVDCQYCHVSPAFDQAQKDDKPPKQVARKMITMVQDLNKKSFGGRQVVTCYTCHRGSTTPLAVPMLPTDPVAPDLVGPAADQSKPSEPALPTVDQILDKYIQALGGEQALRKVTSRVITSTQTIPTGPGGQIAVPTQAEQYRKAPNLVLNVYHAPAYTISNGFDGKTQWSQDMNGVVLDAFDLDTQRARRSGDLFEPLDLKQQYTRLVVRGMEKVNNRDAYVLIGLPAGDKAERLYFDVQSGLLVRKSSALPTPVGDSPVQVDYDDYRDTGSGVKIPYIIRMSPASLRSELQTSTTIQVQKVQDNVAIDDGKFTKPPSKPAPPAPVASPQSSAPAR